MTYFHGQNVEKHKKDKIVTLSFPKFVSFYHLSVPEGPRISEILFAILHTKIKGFFIFIKNKKDKKNNKQPRQVFLSKQLHSFNYL